MAGKREGEKDEEGKRAGNERKGEAGESETRHGKDAEHVAFGPLDIKRHLKDDGRTLILYTLRERRDDT